MSNLVESILDDEGVHNFAKEDEVLAPLSLELGLINDDGILDFTRSILMKMPEEFWALPNLSDEHPPDEAEEGGNIKHIRRMVRCAAQMSVAQEVEQHDRDILISASILHTTPQVLNREDNPTKHETFHQTFHQYAIDGLFRWAREEDDKSATDVKSSTLWMDEEQLARVARLIRVQDGIWSPIPETIPLTNLEWIMHLSELLSTNLAYLIDGNDICDWRWDPPEEEEG